ncbi:Gfo/Idh/MocA family oxidoreductase [Kribbella sp. NBC_01245]|uniref:Gfo/Idh/MocA family oxidoreductase n=1 Tax=Kribbella sp. NBC_01245 TaxID=2903578 RepID=UPI002E2BD411|nr:Gfo/Idh/MocA family oxidoreductase [Kribbella sp. NBC_01245]
MSRRLRVVVCGTTFGQFYQAAVKALADEFELAGIVGRGSERTMNCARRMGVPLYRSPDEVPAQVDAACVVVRSGVMGGSGSEIAREFLTRGIHVLQEQPVHQGELADNYRAARATGTTYRLGDLYVHLPAVRRFVAAARALLAEGPASYVDAACSMQVAFPLLHLLGDALGVLRPWQVIAVGNEAPMSVLHGTIGGVPLTLRIQNEVDPDDPDNHIHLLHRVTIGTSSGSLSLTDTHGPVLWSPRLHIPAAVRERYDFFGAGTDHLADASSIALGPATPASYREALSRHWPAAIGADLLAFRASILGSTYRPEQYHLTLSRMWQDVTSALGYPALRPGQGHQPLPVGALAAAVAGITDGDR